MEKEEIEVLVARPEHEIYVDTILDTIAEQLRYAAQVLPSALTNM